MSLKARMELLEEGKIYRGIVRNVAPFGLFVELIEGQEDGVLLLERTPYPEIARLLQPGQAVEVITTVVDVELEVVRVKLLPNPTRYDGFWSRLA
jgi:ribosomal protein S1